MSLEEQNPIPTAVKELLALFEGPLASVTFPDVDGAALRDQAASVDAAVRDVEAAAAAWAEAKRTVDARLEVLLQKAQRALAYARIYAEDKPELDATLAALVVPRWGDPRGQRAAGAANRTTSQEMAPARKRGRPRKSDVPTPPPPAVEPAITLLPESTPLPPVAEATTSPVEEIDIAAELADESEDAA